MSEARPEYRRNARSWVPDPWEAARVRELRGHLGATQREFAEWLGTRQQTVSEWETGASRPRAMARRLLNLVAEERGFYATEARSPTDGDAAALPADGAGAAATGSEPADGTET